MKQPSLDWQEVNSIIENALREDIGGGDITTNSLFPADSQARAFLKVKESGVIAGMPVARKVFEKLDRNIKWNVKIKEGQRVQPGEVLAEISGATRAILSGERLALNILQRLSGIATMTAAYVAAVEGRDVNILDTRKTLPGLRILEKYAVAVGGGQNHRFGLFDSILIKDNHIKFAGGIQTAVGMVKEADVAGLPIEVETSNLEEVREALEAGADIIMLDNMTPAQMREAVHLISGKARVEASGGITLGRIPEIAQTGIDSISVGALTHSARALDIGLYFY